MPENRKVFKLEISSIIMAMVKCLVCGIVFKDRSPHLTGNKFCNREHWRQYIKENGTWNKGKDWKEMYDKSTYDKLKARITTTGKDHLRYGIRRPDMTLKNLIDNPMHSKEKRQQIEKDLSEDYEETIKKLMKNMTHDKRIAYQRIARETYGKSCTICGATKDEIQIDTHHKDGNHENNKIENLQVICASCHKKLHWEQDKKEVKNEK